MARLFDDGSNESLDIDVGILTGAPMTVACGFNSNDADINQVLIGLVDSAVADNFFFLLYNGGGTDVLQALTKDGGSTASASTATAYSINTDSHACAVFASPTSRSVYIDGGSKGSDTASSTPTSINRFSVGRAGDSSPNREFSGTIWDVGLWDIALTDAEILDLALFKKSPLLMRPEHLVGYWLPKWQGPGLAKNYAPNARNYTLTPTGTVLAPHPPVIYPLRHRIIGKKVAAAGLGIPIAYHHRQRN